MMIAYVYSLLFTTVKTLSHIKRKPHSACLQLYLDRSFLSRLGYKEDVCYNGYDNGIYIFNSGAQCIKNCLDVTKYNQIRILGLSQPPRFSFFLRTDPDSLFSDTQLDQKMVPLQTKHMLGENVLAFLEPYNTKCPQHRAWR